MKLIFLAPGNSIHSKKWIDFFLHKADYEVVWISFDGFDYEAGSDTIHLQSFSRLFYLNPIAWLKLYRLGKSGDVVQIHSLGFYALAGFLMFPKKVIGTAWGSDIVFGAASKLRRLYLKLVVAKCDHVTCDAEHMVRRLNDLGKPDADISVINFGVDSKVFYPQPDKVSTEHPYIISTRNFEPVYDVSTMIDAFALLGDEYADYRLVLVGSGGLEASLKQKVREMGLGNRVTFTGRITQSELVTFLNNAKLYVSSSLSDGGIAASTAEAMLCETTVVISNIGDNADWVSPGDNGYLFEAGDASDLALQMKRALSSDSNALRMAKAGRQTIIERNDYYTEMDKVDVIYNL